MTIFLSKNKRYENYLNEIKSVYEKDKLLLEERISKLQQELYNYKNGCNSSLESSYISDASKEISMVQLTEQFTDMAQKYSDLKIKSNTESKSLKERIKELEDTLKDARDYGSKFKRKYDETMKSNKEETNKLRLKIKLLEQTNNENQNKIKEFSDLKKQVTKFKNDMLKYETIEKKLKGAIQK